MTYADFICKQLDDIEAGMPIYTANMAKKLSIEYGLDQKESAAATAVVFKRIMDDNIVPALRFYQRGIYYLTVMTAFGEVPINKDQLIADKYLLPHNGYETGHVILHRFGLTSQIPRERCFVSNRATDCTRMDKKLDVLIRPPKTQITQENKAYLQFLDALDLLDKAPIDAEHPYAILASYVQKAELDYMLLLSLAYKFYSKKTIMQLAHTASEGGIR